MIRSRTVNTIHELATQGKLWSCPDFGGRRREICSHPIRRIRRTKLNQRTLKLLQNIMVSHINKDNHGVAFIGPDDANIHVDTAFV